MATKPIATMTTVKKPAVKPMAVVQEPIPSEIADKMQTMKNNRAAKNYTKTNPSGYAGISFDKD